MSTGFDSGDLDNSEWAEWYLLTPQERWRETERLWQFYLSVGGSLDPEPDSQTPFHFADDSDDESARLQSDEPIIRGGRGVARGRTREEEHGQAEYTARPE